MKTQNKKSLLSALGKAAREVYLNDNPHGFSKGSTTSKNKKKYTRKKKHKMDSGV